MEALEERGTSEPSAAPRDPLSSQAEGRITVRDTAKVTLLDPARDRTGQQEAPNPPSNSTESGRSEGKAHRLRIPSWRRRARREVDAVPRGPGSADVLAFPEPLGRRRRRRVLIGAAVAVLLVAALFAVLLFTRLVAVRTITVQGTHLLSAQKVESVLEPVRGKPLVTVGSDEVARLVGRFVEVKSARSRAVPPDTLVVQIVERVPVAVVKQDAKLLVVDGDGVVLGEARDTSQYAVPVIDGSTTPMGQTVFRSVTAVLGALPADVLGRLATASAQSADSVELKLSDGRTVVWGNADERELKAKVLAALMRAADNAEKGQAPVRVFDVSTPRHPVTR
ncbi:FtsQ-type POTRA domain-containing protein [Sinomonas notoginsengisoli]|uniref:cell division protein FtsQ/DivIB n=1 Tax=Sinomonas notoginsengisoli TaxID=1457311 RepID=UPI001F2A1C51|nr:FtsQ-type POTRA domain-containing protein [Sinomonas notoginsengisoli]